MFNGSAHAADSKDGIRITCGCSELENVMIVRSRECQSELDSVSQKSRMSVRSRECKLELEIVNQKSRMSVRFR
eukprot:2651690-Heterocapsa_arctica.AAC.1